MKMLNLSWCCLKTPENNRKLKEQREDKSIETKECFSFEEALEETGNGWYNITLLAIMTLTFMSMGLDMFGFSITVIGCSCEFNLTMAQKSLLNSMPFAGPISMSYAWGYISDTQGRRKSLLIAMIVSCLVSALSCLSPNWIALAVLKFLSTSFSSCAQAVTYVLLGESCSRQVRGTYMLLITAFFCTNLTYSYVIGYYILNMDFVYNLGLLGHFTPWRLFALVNALPLGLVALLLLTLYESPKFLANEGREADALRVLKMIWIRNGGDPEKFRVKSITLEDQDINRRSSVPLLQSIWRQTVPLFKPPYLLRSLQLYYLNAVIFSTSNGFVVWFPTIADAFFSSLKSSGNESTGLCDLMMAGHTKHASENVTCSSKLEEYTFISGTAYTSLFFIIFLMISQAYTLKKTVMIGLLMTSTLASAAVTLTPEPVSAILLYVCITVQMVGSGLTASYFVELFPTSYRGMISCLGMVVARVTGLAGINMVGALALSHCQTMFFGWSLFCFSGVIVACFLPSNKLIEKNSVVGN